MYKKFYRFYFTFISNIKIKADVFITLSMVFVENKWTYFKFRHPFSSVKRIEYQI